MNKVILIGRLGKDPESKTTNSGMVITNFSIATDDRKKVGDTWEKITDWHNIVTFGKTAEIAAKYLSKGSQCAIDGKIKTESYEKNGEKRWATKIIAEKIELLGGGSENQKSYAKEEAKNPFTSYNNMQKIEEKQISFDDDDIPF